MIEKVIFFVLSITILAVTIIKYVKRKDLTYIILLIFELTGIIFQASILNLSFAERNVDYNYFSLFKYSYSTYCIYFGKEKNLFIRSNRIVFC